MVNFIKQYDLYFFIFFLTLYFFLYLIISLSLKYNNNLIRILFLFELILFVISLLFLIIGFHYNDIYGQIVIFFILSIGAVEAAIGLALLYIYHKLWRLSRLSTLKYLKV